MSELKNHHTSADSPDLKAQLKVPCVYKDRCAGCQYLDLNYADQRSLKISQLEGLLASRHLGTLPAIEFHSAGASHLRDRLDFSLEDGRLGLYRKDKREILDIEICAQLSPELQAWLTEFRTLQFPFKKGSIRLRVSPSGERGVWLDFANIDIKALLDEQKILHFLQERSFVEIGQRRKIPVWEGSEFKLRDPEMRPWFQTWIEDAPVNLFCQIASFTQPSHRANKIICDIISQWVKNLANGRWIEFGSGIGNLTFPALGSAAHITACEIDALSLAGLEKTLENLPSSLAHLKDRIEIHRGDFQRKLSPDFAPFDGILANPPRSGLMGFLDSIARITPSQRPRQFIYMSCFPESLALDLERLIEFGYEVLELKIVDQFPQTAHYEVLALLQRKQS